MSESECDDWRSFTENSDTEKYDIDDVYRVRSAALYNLVFKNINFYLEWFKLFSTAITTEQKLARNRLISMLQQQMQKNVYIEIPAHTDPEINTTDLCEIYDKVQEKMLKAPNQYASKIEKTTVKVPKQTQTKRDIQTKKLLRKLHNMHMDLDSLQQRNAQLMKQLEVLHYNYDHYDKLKGSLETLLNVRTKETFINFELDSQMQRPFRLFEDIFRDVAIDENFVMLLRQIDNEFNNTFQKILDEVKCKHKKHIKGALKAKYLKRLKLQKLEQKLRWETIKIKAFTKAKEDQYNFHHGAGESFNNMLEVLKIFEEEL